MNEMVWNHSWPLVSPEEYHSLVCSGAGRRQYAPDTVRISIQYISVLGFQYYKELYFTLKSVTKQIHSEPNKFLADLP